MVNGGANLGIFLAKRRDMLQRNPRSKEKKKQTF
jgi:hypothetical protein